MRKNQSVPVYLQKKFNNSFSNVEENLSWFKKHHLKIGEWTKAYIEEHGLDVHLITNSSTVPPETSSDETPQLSGSSFNYQSFSFVTLLIMLTLLVNG